MHVHRLLANASSILAAAMSLVSPAASAANWVAFYAIGDDRYAVDADSISAQAGLIRYRSGIVGKEASIVAMQADCAARTRGQLPKPQMSSTFPGTIGGEEVAAACKLAAARQGAEQTQRTSPGIAPGQELEFLKQDDIRHFCDGVMGSVGSDNFKGTMSQIQEHLSAPAQRVKYLSNALDSWYTLTLTQLGYAQGYEFVKQEGFSNTLLRLTFLARYQRGATRWVFTFYNRSEGWVLTDVGSDANLQPVFDR